MPRDGLTTFGDLIGQLEQIAFACPKCGLLGRYSVRRLALAHGPHHLLAEWLDDMARDCSRKVSAVAGDGCGAECPELAQVAPPSAANARPIRYANDDRHSHVLSRAAELAKSGKFSGWVAIEAQLRFVEGYPEARRWLEDEYLRLELDRLCIAARKV